MKPKQTKTEVEVAERRVGAVLDELESRTGDEVVDISLEDMVNTDPATGAPVVEKAVDIRTREKPARRWSR